jgi:hypothetical protein
MRTIQVYNDKAARDVIRHPKQVRNILYHSNMIPIDVHLGGTSYPSVITILYNVKICLSFCTDNKRTNL